MRGKLLDFLGGSSCRAWGREADWDGRGGTSTCCSFSSTWSESKGGRWATHSSGLVGYPLVMLKDEPSLRWWVMGRPWLSSRAGWPWSALGVCFRQHLSCCIYLKGPLRGFAALHLLARGPVFWMEKGWTGEDHKAQSGLFWWWLSDCCLHYQYINSLLFFVPSPAICSIQVTLVMFI